MVTNTTTTATEISAVTSALWTYHYGTQGTRLETFNPLDHYIGEEKAPTHVIFVLGRLHAVQVGWSKKEADAFLADDIDQILMFPHFVVTPAFTLSEAAEIRRAVKKAEHNRQDLPDALQHLAPSLAREIRRLAAGFVWSRWAYDRVQTDMRTALNASIAAVDPDTPFMDEMQISDAIADARAIRLEF